MRSSVRAAWILVSCAAGLLGGRAAAAQAPRSRSAGVVECGKCHGNRDLLAANASGATRDTGLYVTRAVLDSSVHRMLQCTDCHQGFGAGFPHQASQIVVPCETCHAQEGRNYDASIHARNARTEGDAPTCVGCHGSHRILSPENPRSPTYPLNVAGLCSRCHADPKIIGRYFTGPGDQEARIAATAFPKSVHGIALTKDGLVVSATCPDCHRAHLILPPDSARSSVNRANIPQTCGNCHAGVVKVFEASAHGPDYRKEPGIAVGHQRPVCIDCHTAHEIVPADQPAWERSTVKKCGACHEHLYETYFETYHGQVTQLGSNLAAKCSDCHTAHDMRSPTDPKSTVFPANLTKTCGQCHAGANANFVKYYPHGDPTQRTRYPRLYWPWLFMTALLVGVMTFFVIHSVLWLIRNGIEHAQADSGRDEPPRGGAAGPEPFGHELPGPGGTRTGGQP